ncbi:WecB/TagA/CpsF family glycosyltransferase [Neptunicoccus sediminis]|uniref:WecB/TagA/CpsF family glycosyltransferase n=1 Tax=Neptunicoccus sediminis TaxID=1892596 RepID=UPI0008460F59|nr:WecB/TagA/CpsF family glycosyltransferase [Neptunicoccus sediminis]
MADIYWGQNAPAGKVRITHPNRDALLGEISDRLAKRQGFALATLNLDHCVKLRQNPDFKAAYLHHSHVVADGNPIVWLSRLAGRPVDLVPGSELITPLADLAAKHGVPVALFGSTPDTLSATATALEAAHPGLEIVAQIAPPFGFDPTGEDAGELIAKLGASGAGLCFLALGAPKQEILAVRGAEALPACGFVSIGAGLDFIAGTQHRAPRIVQRLALEWLWRLAGNPGRLARRYGACFAILPELAWTARKDRPPQQNRA